MNPRSAIPTPKNPPTGDDLQMVSFKLSSEHREWLRVASFRRRSTKTDIVRELLDAAIANERKGKAA